MKQFSTNWAVLQECGHGSLQICWFRSAVKLFNSMLNTNSVTLRKSVQTDLNSQPRSSACWTAQLLSDFQGLCGCDLYVQAVQTESTIPMQEFTADLKHRMRGVWRDAELVDPNTHNNKLTIYHSWFAIPFSRNKRMLTIVPRYPHLDLSKHVMRNVSRLCLRAHTLKVEAATWLEDGSRICDQCPGEDEHVQNEAHALLTCQDLRVCEPRKHLSFLFPPYFEDFSAAQPFSLQQVNNQLVHYFLF